MLVGSKPGADPGDFEDRVRDAHAVMREHDRYLKSLERSYAENPVGFAG
jgi:hypothetical protein